MARITKRVSSMLLALGVTAVLAFGAQTVLAGGSPPCTEGLPSHTCASETDPDGFCDQFCDINNWEGGQCDEFQDCCICFI